MGEHDGAAPPPSAHVHVRVPSKINLFLAVRGRRSDGFHDITSIMQTVGLHDEVTARLHAAGLAQHPALRRFMDVDLVHDAHPGVPDGDDNLTIQAAEALLDTVTAGTNGADPPEVAPRTRLELVKRIPVGGGMAGGSADAAATLVALNELWGLELDRDELREIAAEIGADVPFCVTGGTALATATGTITAQVLCRGRFHWVIGMDREPLATPEVYAAWDRTREPSEIEPDAVLQALQTDDAVTLGASLHNDLEPAAFALRPRLREARDGLLEAGALGALVSGSGPTVVGLAADAVGARELAEVTAHLFDRVEIAVSPAGGPEVLGRAG